MNPHTARNQRSRAELIADFIRLGFSIPAVAGFRGMSVEALEIRMRAYRISQRLLSELKVKHSQLSEP